MAKTEHPPSVSETAFDCPHCGAYTTQYWHDAYADRTEKNATPSFWEPEALKKKLKEDGLALDTAQPFIEFQTRKWNGEIFIDEDGEWKSGPHLHNIYLSKCFNCKRIAVWAHKTLIYPAVAVVGPEPSADMPADVRRDFEEARKIVKESPRGACALLRLAVQKLCIALEQPEKNLDGAIAALVAKGLPGKVKKSLDIVRVIGNQAVHPGEFDLQDDAGTAVQLFSLVNIIVEQMITSPKAVDEIYEGLPASKREAIERRDAEASGNNLEDGEASDSAS